MTYFTFLTDQLFQPKIKRRGLAYKNEDRVHNLEIKGYNISAEVTGSKKYFVNIKFNPEENRSTELYCSCPFFEQTNCKHLAAVFYELRSIDFFDERFSKMLDDYNNQSSFANLNDRDRLITEFQKNGKNNSVLTVTEREKLIEEVNRKSAEAKFNQFKIAAGKLIPKEEKRKNKQNYRIVYGISPSGYSTTLYAYRQLVKLDGTVSHSNILTTLNEEDFKSLTVEEKLILGRFQANSGKISIAVETPESKSKNNKDIIEKDLFSEILIYLSEQTVYLHSFHLISGNSIDIIKKQALCKLLIEENGGYYRLSLQFFIDEKPVKSETEIIPIMDEPLWLKVDNQIFRVNNFTIEQLEFFKDNKGIFDIPKDYLYYFEETVLPQVAKNLPVVSSIYNIEELRTSFQSILYLDEDGDSLIINLKFKYGEYELPYKENQESTIILKDKNIIRILRETEKEEEAYQKIKSTYVKELSPGVFSPRNDPTKYLFKYLIYFKDNKFDVLGEAGLKNYKINTASPSLKFKVVSGIDWFDVKANISFEGTPVSLDALMKSIKGKKNYIRLSDGSIGMLPENWIKKFQRSVIFGDVNQDSVRFSKIHVNTLDFLIKEGESYESDEEFKKHFEKLNNFEKIKTHRVSPKFNGKLRAYQKFGFDWFYFLQEFGFGGILADDMGLGKTIQVLALLMKEKTKGKGSSLVVAPTSVVFNWINEASGFTPSLKILNHTGNERMKDNSFHFEDYDLILTSYGTLRRDEKILSEFTFNYLILDESQNIKNPLSKTARIAKKLKAENRLCLTGTPMENNLTELWSQMTFLNPGMFGSLNKFSDAYIKPISKMNDETVVEDLRKAVYPFLLRRTKDVVAKELPPKTEIVQYCEMEPEQERIYNIWKDSIRDEIIKEIAQKGIRRTGFKVIEGLLRLRQICNHPMLVKENYNKKSGKFEEFKEELMNVVGEGHKVLIFSQFVQMLEIMKAFLEKEDISFEYLTGSTRNREECVNNFQNDDSVKVFLISLKAGGFGLNLTAADYVFHYDPWWNPAVEQQATDRTHRIGQRKNVFVYKFITRNSVEEKILNLQAKKRKLVENIITSESGVLKNLTKNDVELLFS